MHRDTIHHLTRRSSPEYDRDHMRRLFAVIGPEDFPETVQALAESDTEEEEDASR